MIEIIHERENEKDKTIFFNLTMNGETFEWHGDVPKEADAQAFLDARIDNIKFLIFFRYYRESDYKRFLKDGKTKLEAMREWISKGHKNKIIVGYKDKEKTKPTCGYKVIEKEELTYRHPKEIKLKPLIDGAVNIEQIKEILHKIL